MSEALAHVEQLTTLSKAKGFLGREFLTWLWYVAETQKETLSLEPLDKEGEIEVDLWVDDRIVLEAATGQSHQNVMKGGDPSASREAEAALSTGKTVREMKLGMNVKGAGEFTAILNCDDLNPRGLKLPQRDKEDGAAPSEDLPVIQRLRHLEIYLSALDSLFARFLSVRTEDGWEKGGLADMRAWIKKRQSKADSATIH